jgi:hypothetical protein
LLEYGDLKAAIAGRVAARGINSMSVFGYLSGKHYVDFAKVSAN